MSKRCEKVIYKDPDGGLQEAVMAVRAENIQGLLALQTATPEEADAVVAVRGKRPRRVTMESVKSWLSGLFAAKSHGHTAAEIGAAEAGHSHAWSQVTGKPGTFPPAGHTHTRADITDLGNLRVSCGQGPLTAGSSPLAAGTVYVQYE